MRLAASPWLGREYVTALGEARLAGCPPTRIKLTRPPSRSLGSGRLRVIAEQTVDEQCCWVLAYEAYLRYQPFTRHQEER